MSGHEPDPEGEEEGMAPQEGADAEVQAGPEEEEREGEDDDLLKCVELEQPVPLSLGALRDHVITLSLSDEEEEKAESRIEHSDHNCSMRSKSANREEDSNHDSCRPSKANVG